VRSRSPSGSTKSRTRRQSSKSDTDDHDGHKTKRSAKSDHNQGKKLSALKRIGKPIQSFWKKYLNVIKNILKALVVSSILIGGIIFLALKGGDLFPHREGKLTSNLK
jgi:hypothetical protein